MKCSVQIKDRLQQQMLEKKYERYKLEEDELITYKEKIYIPTVSYLRKLWMKSIKLHILVTQDIRKQSLQLESSIFGEE